MTVCWAIRNRRLITVSVGEVQALFDGQGSLWRRWLKPRRIHALPNRSQKHPNSQAGTPASTSPVPIQVADSEQEPESPMPIENQAWPLSGQGWGRSTKFGSGVLTRTFLCGMKLAASSIPPTVCVELCGLFVFVGQEAHPMHVKIRARSEHSSWCSTSAAD